MNRVPTYIALDTETGGIGEDKSLLTAYLVILDQDFEMIGELDLATKPNDDIYSVTGEALRINNINLAEHDLNAISCKEAGTQIYNFLEKYNPKGEIKLIPVGHNVAFDIRFMCNHTLSKKSWDKYVGYRVIDTGTVSMFLIKAGVLPSDLNAGLGSLAKYFNIEFEAHTAKGDTWATIKVAKNLLDLVKKK